MIAFRVRYLYHKLVSGVFPGRAARIVIDGRSSNQYLKRSRHHEILKYLKKMESILTTEGHVSYLKEKGKPTFLGFHAYVGTVKGTYPASHGFPKAIQSILSSGTWIFE